MIGVRLPNWLGDVLLARRALAVLGRRLGGGGMAVAAPAAFLPLLEPGAPGWRWLPAGRGAAAAWRLGAAWRALAVTEVYSFPVSLSSQLAALRSGARRRVGFARRPGEWRDLEAGLAWTERVPRGPRGAVPLEEEYLALVGEPPAAAPVELLRVPPGPPPPPPFDGMGRRVLVLAPGARYGPAKRWPEGSFLAAGREALEAGLADAICLVGEAADAPLCERLARALGTAAHSLAGRTDLVLLARVLSRAHAVVANDSGAAHLSAALGIPTVVLFGSTDPAWTAPGGPHVRVLHEALRCSPCFRRTCPWRDDAYACLHVLEPRAAVAALRHLGAGAAA